LPSNSLQRTRSGGGLYLLASAFAHSRILGAVEATSSAISFKTDGLIVSGVYLQLTMSCEDVAATLRSVATSAVILGDANARLPWLETQSGGPGPPRREWRPWPTLFAAMHSPLSSPRVRGLLRLRLVFPRRRSRSNR
jgi:hypothetical protein